MSISVLSTSLAMPHVKVCVEDGWAVLSTVGGWAWGCSCVPGNTKHVWEFSPSRLHSASSLMCSRMIWSDGTPAFQVAVPIVWELPSKPMLLGLPSGRWKEKLSKLGGSVHALASSPTATVLTLSGCVPG